MNNSENSINEEENDDVSSDQLITSDAEINEREKGLTVFFYRVFGSIFVSLSLIILIIVTISFFYHSGQPDETVLLTEQITGFSLAGFSLILGTVFLIYANHKKKKQQFIVEPLNIDD
ncbi:MAG TPA: hypothetical protein VMX55_05025 [candidate division Zixibacteria bacterium]|nr:hypothetical protein [candidate division Zixibacteria bacterium]